MSDSNHYGDIRFPRELSEEGCCPVCGSFPEYCSLSVEDESERHEWKCPVCGANGTEHYRLVFDGHSVAMGTVSEDRRCALQTAPDSGPLKAGDVVCTSGQANIPNCVGKITGLASDDFPESLEYFIVDFGEALGSCTVHRDAMARYVS